MIAPEIPRPPTDRRTPPGLATRNPQRLYILHAALPFLASAALLVLFENTDIDRAIEDRFYDPKTHTFPLRKSLPFELIFHDGTRWVVFIVAGLVALGIVLSLRNPRVRPWRRALVYVALCLAVAPVLIGLWKQQSCKHCPWDLEMYGGYAPYLRLFDPPQSGLKPGHCFPGAHASGGFALISIYFALRLWDLRRARLWLAIAITFGALQGFERMIQGAHFLSHNVASLFVCWFVCLALYEIVLRRHDERRFSTSGTA